MYTSRPHAYILYGLRCALFGDSINRLYCYNVFICLHIQLGWGGFAHGTSVDYPTYTNFLTRRFVFYTYSSPIWFIPHVTIVGLMMYKCSTNCVQHPHMQTCPCGALYPKLMCKGLWWSQDLCCLGMDCGQLMLAHMVDEGLANHL